MSRDRPHRLMAVPPTLHARLEIAKAIRSLTAQEADERTRRHAEISALRRDLEEIPELLRKAFAECRVLLAAELRKYSPDQPRVPKSNPRGGEWTRERVGAAPGVSIDGSGTTARDDTSRASRQYAELGTGTRTDATATIGTSARNSGAGTPDRSEAASSSAAPMQSWLQSVWSNIQPAMEQVGEANVQSAQSEIEFQQTHPGLVLASATAPFAVISAIAAWPEVLVGGGALETSGVAEEAPAIARGGVYALRDIKGTVVRTGRTGDLARRAAEHARDPLLKDFFFDPLYRTDEYAEQRGLEQILHDSHNPPHNKINPIDPANPKFDEFMNAAKNYLNRVRQ